MAHITIGVTATRADYVASSLQTEFSIPFEFFDEDDLLVYQNNVLLTKTTNYTVTPVTTEEGGYDGGTVDLVVGATLDDDIAIVLDMSLDRDSDFPTTGPFNINTLNTTLDKNVVRLKQIDEKLDRAIIGPVSEVFDGTLPVAATRATRILSFDSAGALTTLDPDSLTIATLAGFTDNNTEYFSGNGATTSFTLASDPVVVDNVAVYIGGVRQQPGAGKDYTLSGLAVVFSSAPVTGTDNIQITYGQAISTPATFADGSVGTPAIRFTDDTNTGFYRIGTGNIGVASDGALVADFAAALATFATAVTATGVITGATVEATGATSASDNAAMGYTSGGGLSLTGQGSTSDLTILNAAAATVISVPTGTTNVTFGGDIVSDTDSTDDIGTNAVRWATAYVDSLTLTDNATIGGNLTVTGDLTINGTTVTNDATNTEVKDPLIEINSGAGSNANDLGTVAERGSTGDNVFWGWDESADRFVAGLTTATGSSTGNISFSAMAEVEFGNVVATGATFSGTSSDLGTVTTVDINGGTVDGAVIGGASAAAVTGTTVTGVSLVASQDLALATGATVTGIDDGVISTGSATLLATQGAIDTAINSSSKAAGISMTWETTTTDTDQGVGKVWANHGTLSSATVLYFDDVERNSVSINALIDSLDDATASTSATIYIQEAGSATAGVLFKVSGAVTSASTYSKVAVTHVATFGTLSDGDVVGVTFAFSGDDGAGSGDLVAANNLSDVASASSAASNIGVGTEDSPTFTKISVTGDTSAGDAAAIGYTAAEGLILTGQGSTSDLTVKNDADAVVFTVPTGTDDILFPDDAKAMWGTDSDSEIYHNGSNMYVKNDTGNTLLYSDTFQFFSHTGNELFAQLNHNSACNFYYDNSKKLETTSGGVEVTGAMDADNFLISSAQGSDGQVLTSTGSGVAWEAASGGKFVQQVYATDATFASTTSTFPRDDTIPQNTEGAEAVTVAITPTNSSNYLLIQSGGMYTNTVSVTHVAIAIFQDTTAGAIAASGFGTSSGSNPNSGTITHRMTAGTTSSTTFKLRFAGQSGTSYRNGDQYNRLYGGTTNSWIMVTEIEA